MFVRPNLASFGCWYLKPQFSLFALEHQLDWFKTKGWIAFQRKLRCFCKPALVPQAEQHHLSARQPRSVPFTPKLFLFLSASCWVFCLTEFRRLSCVFPGFRPFCFLEILNLAFTIDSSSHVWNSLMCIYKKNLDCFSLWISSETL